LIYLTTPELAPVIQRRTIIFYNAASITIQFILLTPLYFSIDLKLPAALWLWGQFGQPKMGTRNLPGGKVRPVLKADNFTAVCELDV
jgi:hypothetical protein